MKWFRITSIGCQLAIFLTLVILLCWDSTPVPGPDGRVVCEVYEFPFAYRAPHRAITIFAVQRRSDLADNAIVAIVSNAPIVKTTWNEPIQAMKCLVTSVPFLNGILPNKLRYRIDGGRVIEISLTLDEWKRLRATRREEDGTIGCRLHE